MTVKSNKRSIVMLGASGAVGTEVLNTLLQLKNILSITLLGRKSISNINVELFINTKLI